MIKANTWEPGIPKELGKDFLLLVDTVIDPIEGLSEMVKLVRKYFRTFAEKDRIEVKTAIRNIRKQENMADKQEDRLKMKIFSEVKDPVTIFHMIRLVESIGSIANHAENAGDMMRAMIAK